MTAFAELCVTTNFSFLRGGSHPEELVNRAMELGLAGIAVADRNTLAGVVRGHVAAKEAGFRYAVGCRLAFRDGTPDILAWPTDRAAYGRLCRLLTLGNRRAEKGACHLDLADLLEWGEGLILGIVPEATLGGVLETTLAALKDAFPGNVRLMASRLYGPADDRRLALLDRMARCFTVPLLASNDVLYHIPERRPLQDVLTCIREHKTLATAGRLLPANAERHLKAPAEMARLFRNHPQALAESRAVLERLAFSLDELRYQYPDEPTGDAATPQDALEKLTAEGARRRYPGGVPAKVQAAIDHELALIRQRDYAPYFLTVYDIVRFARSREKEILCQGRGSAANSAVCFVLGITEVDPDRIDLLFERFVSAERNEPPDIDVDFEHERREEVMQYVYEKYGRHRAGLAATVITYRSRSAVREVGKAFGLSEDAVGALSSTIWGWSTEGVRHDDVRRAGLDPADWTMARVLELSREIAGFPRHLSQHVGGFVMTRDRLDEVCPIMNAAMEDRTTVEWDKDDLDALGILKVDVLALGMLSCIRRAFEFLDKHYGGAPTLATIPPDDPAVYDMLCRADSLGVFQVESRAQMSMLPRLKPRSFYDLVIEVAIVRPGPIQGDMVHPYLKRRANPDTVTYPSPELEAVLKKTLGVPLFQEQAMKIAIIGAGFTPGEADRLRRAMATFRRLGTIGSFRGKFIDGMIARCYDHDFAERCFRQIEGFGDYGFPESHAASFALLVYASAWLKCHYPDVFCAALLNSQPMGFYAPAQIVRDAREHGVAVLPVDINHSDWDCTLEPEHPRTSQASTPSQPPPFRATTFTLLDRGQERHLLSRRERIRSLARRKAGLGGVGEGLREGAEQDAAAAVPSPDGSHNPSPSSTKLRSAEQVSLSSPSGRGGAPSCHECQGGPGQCRRCVNRVAERGRGRSGEDPASLFEEEIRLGGVEPASSEADHFPTRQAAQDGASHPNRVPPPARLRRSEAAPASPRRERERTGGGQQPDNPNEGTSGSDHEAAKTAQARLHPAHAGMRGAIRTTHGVRLGFREIKGFRQEDAEALMTARRAGYDSVRDLWLRTGLTRAAIERLADADAFRSVGLDRRDALWAARALGSGKERLPLFDTPHHAAIASEPDVALPPMPIGEHVVNDYRYLGLSLKAHPVFFLRRSLGERQVVANRTLTGVADGRRVSVSGLVLVRQRPGTAKGVIFMTIEDETGIANIIVWPKTFERFRPVVLGARLVAVTGRVQSESSVIHVVADRLEDLTPMLAILSEDASDARAMKPLSRADEVKRPPNRDSRAKPPARHPRDIDTDLRVVADFAETAGKVMPRGRNFH